MSNLEQNLKIAEALVIAMIDDGVEEREIFVYPEDLSEFAKSNSVKLCANGYVVSIVKSTFDRPGHPLMHSFRQENSREFDENNIVSEEQALENLNAV